MASNIMSRNSNLQCLKTFLSLGFFQDFSVLSWLILPLSAPVYVVNLAFLTPSISTDIHLHTFLSRTHSVHRTLSCCLLYLCSHSPPPPGSHPWFPSGYCLSLSPPSVSQLCLAEGTNCGRENTGTQIHHSLSVCLSYTRQPCCLKEGCRVSVCLHDFTCPIREPTSWSFLRS